MPISVEWTGSHGELMALEDLKDFVAWAYGHGGTDRTPIRVETNVAVRAARVGIKKMWMETT